MEDYKSIYENLKDNGSFVDDIRNQRKYCPSCGTLMAWKGEIFKCSTCGHEEYDDFTRVKKYLELNPKATAYAIATALHLPLSQINGYVETGRLEVTPDSKVYFQCQLCGAPIRYGKICTTCATKSIAQKQGYRVAEVGSEPEKGYKGRMHISFGETGKR